jgi:hypothetical protein
MDKLFFGLFMLAHGVVHPLLAYVPAKEDDSKIGGLWVRSWLLGEGPGVKKMIWGSSWGGLFLALLAALALWGLLPGLGWPGPMALYAGASLAVLLIFWYRDFILGILIDLALFYLASQNPFGW